METPDQARLFDQLLKGVDRLTAWATKANGVGCTLLAHNLIAHAQDIRESVAMQRRALIDPGFTGAVIRHGACPSCGQPKEESIRNHCQEPFHLWFCSEEACPGHAPGTVKQDCTSS